MHTGKKIGVYVVGLFVLAMGVAISVKSNLGVSPVSSLPYVLSVITPMEMGYYTMAVFAFYIFLQFLLLGKDFKVYSTLQIVGSIAFGYFVNLANALLGFFPAAEGPLLRGFLAFLSTVVCGFGIFLYVGAKVMPLPAEGLTEALSIKTKRPFAKVKVSLDLVLVALSVLFSLIFLRRLQGIGFGTILAALLIGKFVGIFMTHLRDPLHQFLGTTAPLLEKPIVKVPTKAWKKS